MNEQIQKEISKQIAELDNFHIGLKSKYRVFTYSGRADGSLLSGITGLDDLIGRIIIIKSIKFFPYTFGDMIDFKFFDGVTNTTETVVTNTRLVRVFDDFVFATTIKYTLNGNDIIFKSGTGLGYPIDLQLDNIFYKFPQKLATLDISVNARINSDFTGTLVAPNIKVVTECYVI